MMDKRRALLEEKRKLLIENQRAAEEARNMGVGSIADVWKPQVAVAEVDVQLATNQAGRVAALRRIVELRRSREQFLDAGRANGTTGRTDMVDAKIARIDAEIALEDALRQTK